MAWHTTMLKGMEEHFLSKQVIKNRIGDRLFAVIATERQLALEEPTREVNRAGEFVEYEIVGDETAQNVDGESDGYQVAILGFTFSALRGKDARNLFAVFFDALKGPGGDNRYSGTWNGREIELARWMRETYSEGFDESVRMVVVNCQLRIVYANQ